MESKYLLNINSELGIILGIYICMILFSLMIIIIIVLYFWVVYKLNLLWRNKFLGRLGLILSYLDFERGIEVLMIWFGFLGNEGLFCVWEDLLYSIEGLNGVVQYLVCVWGEVDFWSYDYVVINMKSMEILQFF